MIFILGKILEQKGIGIGPFGYTESRIEVVDYLHLYKKWKTRIYIKNPTDAFDWNVYTDPLRIESWIGIALFCCFIPLLMVFVLFECKIINLITYYYIKNGKILF